MDSCQKGQSIFVDNHTLLALIQDVQTKLDPIDSDPDKVKAESELLVESFRKNIDKYQEQPELLEQYLSDYVLKLIDGLSDVRVPKTRYHTIFKFLYQLVKVSGFKSIAGKFPHETKKLPFVIDMLTKESPDDKSNWQTRFVLTVWLSIMILTPFDLAKFDSAETNQSILDKIYSNLLKSLGSHDSCQHVASYCLAKFLSRPDVLKLGSTDKFITEALEDLRNIGTGRNHVADDVKLIGYLRSLGYLFKFLPRTESKHRAAQILDVILKLDVQTINRELVNHLLIKLTQRTGLALLPNRMATWRYKRASRILGKSSESHPKDTQSEAPIPIKEHIANDHIEVDDSEESESASFIEAVLSSLFVGAQNTQTKVRWSASKGIARIASRLSRERASDVIDMVLSGFFDHNCSEYAWHGGCLTLAEMSRFGLILEEKLGDVLSVIDEAIIYDKIKGTCAVGAHVREAACYICWALARTYEDHLLKPHVSTISTNLLRTMLFDRELQPRRAASATFQELIGRQGSFDQQEIAIMTSVDYQNVGQRQFTYLHLALQIASHNESYAKSFSKHLIDKKVGHHDIQIRRLAADSLSALSLHSKIDFVESAVLPRLLEMAQQNDDFNLRHGAILSLAKVIRGLIPLQFAFNQYETSHSEEESLIKFVGRVHEKCEKQLKSKQQAGNFLEAIGHLIISCGQVAASQPESVFIKCVDSSTLDRWETMVVQAALSSENGPLREIGANAMLALYQTYYKSDKSGQDRLLSRSLKSLTSLHEATRCGALLALSKLSQVGPTWAPSGDGSCLSSSTSTNGGPAAAAGQTRGQTGCYIRTDADTPSIILSSLISYLDQETHEKSNDIVFAQAKADACLAFVDFVRYLDEFQLVSSSQYLTTGLEALLSKTEDYTFDKRGDIGVVVRRAAIRSLLELTQHLFSLEKICSSSMLRAMYLENRLFERIVARTLQQAVSYNNSAREQAALAFYKLVTLLTDDGGAPAQAEAPCRMATPGFKLSQAIPHHGLMMQLLAQANVDDTFNWRDDSIGIFVKLLGKQEYTADLWIGLFSSVGQISDISAQPFGDALSNYIQSLSTTTPGAETSDELAKQRELVFGGFVSVMKGAKQVSNRLLTSGLIVTDFMLTSGLFHATGDSFQRQLVELCWQSVDMRDPKRISLVARVLGGMLQFPDAKLRLQCLDYCSQLLICKYATVRPYVAEQLYLGIMTHLNSDHDDDGCDHQGDADMRQNVVDQNNGCWDEAMKLLSETRWDEPLERVKSSHATLCACFNKAIIMNE